MFSNTLWCPDMATWINGLRIMTTRYEMHTRLIVNILSIKSLFLSPMSIFWTRQYWDCALKVRSLQEGWFLYQPYWLMREHQTTWYCRPRVPPRHRGRWAYSPQASKGGEVTIVEARGLVFSLWGQWARDTASDIRYQGCAYLQGLLYEAEGWWKNTVYWDMHLLWRWKDQGNIHMLKPASKKGFVTFNHYGGKDQIGPSTD